MTTTAKTEYIIQPASTAKDNYKEKTEANPNVKDSVKINYVVAANLAKDKGFMFDKNLEKTDPLGYDGRNPVEITQAALDKYINKVDATKSAEEQEKARKYKLGGNIRIVSGSYKNNAKKGTAQVTVVGTGQECNGNTFYGTKVLKFKIVEK